MTSAFGAYQSGGQPAAAPPDPPAEVMGILATAWDALPAEQREELLRLFHREPPPPPPARPVFLASGEGPVSSPHGGMLHTGPDGSLYYTSPRGTVTKLAEG